MIELLRDLFDPLFDLLAATLTTFHGWGAPWWLSVAMLTLAVRVLLFPLTIRQAARVRKIRELKPEMDEINTRHKDDPRKRREEITKLHAEYKVNPLGGLLPALVQLPIFVALYYTIKRFEALDSFRAGGLFWFQDLTAADPYLMLPAAYVLTMMAAQEITIRNTAAGQKNLMRVLPVVFGLFLLRFPAGLFVYWITSDVITFFQNLILFRNVPEPAEVTSVPKPDSAVKADNVNAEPGDAPATSKKRRKKKTKKRL